MDKKTVGILSTLGATVICACPSIFLCIWGIVGISGAPIDTTIGGQTTSEPMSSGLAIALICLSLIGLLVPVAVGFFTLRKKPEDGVIDAAPVVPVSDEPLPPAS